jgi:hypothetical protein
LAQKLKQLGFKPSQADTSLFIFRNSGLIMYMLVYVDDIIIMSLRPSATDKLISELTEDFGVKDLGKLHYFLGIEAQPHNNGIILSQQRYAQDLLARAKMTNCRAISTPMSSSGKLARDQGTPLSGEGQYQYRSIVGGLQYLTLTRLDLSFAVNCVCQYMQSPTDTHWTTVKRILRYVKGTMRFSLNFQKSHSDTLSAFSDAD